MIKKWKEVWTTVHRDKEKRNMTEYLVQWKEEPASKASWEKETTLWQFG